MGVLVRDYASDAEALVEERTALQDLLNSEGWRILTRKVRDEFLGEGYFARIQIALAKDDPNAVKVCNETAKQVLAFLTWPAARITELKGVPDA